MVASKEPIAGQGGADGQGGFSDRRARISAKPEVRAKIYGENDPTNIMQPLWTTGGLMFPYTPSIYDTGSVQYDSYDLVHTNQPFAAFNRVNAKEIQVTGTFTAMNQKEAAYCLACIHFLRTVTKMYFGVGGNDNEAKQLRGTPPPILLFNAHGTAIFHNVPVILTSYNVELPLDVDYVKVFGDQRGFVVDGSTSQVAARRGADVVNPRAQALQTFRNGYIGRSISAWIPTRFIVSVQMQVQNTPNRWRRQFNLNDFRTGALVKRGGWV